MWNLEKLRKGISVIDMLMLCVYECMHDSYMHDSMLTCEKFSGKSNE